MGNKGQQFIHRQKEFHGPISLLAQEHSIIEAVIQKYAAGEIVTKEEALSQMVIALADHARKLHEQRLVMAAHCTVPLQALS